MNVLLWCRVAFGIVLLCGMVVAAHAGKRPFVEGGRLEFELRDLEGNPVRSTDPRFDGKVLLVDLWATWCPPCATEIPTLNELQNEFGDRGLIVVAIAFEGEEGENERRARLRESVAEHSIDYLVLDGGSTEEFETALPAVRKVQGFPVEILIDRGGAVTACLVATGACAANPDSTHLLSPPARSIMFSRRSRGPS